MCKIGCCDCFSYGVSAQAGSGTVSVGEQIKAGPISSTASAVAGVSGGALHSAVSKETHLGSVASASRSQAVSIGAGGYAAENGQSLQLGSVNISMEERLSCCGDRGCCDYSINMCGASCTCGTDCCTEAVGAAAEGCFQGLGMAFSCIGETAGFLFEVAIGVLGGD